MHTCTNQHLQLLHRKPARRPYPIKCLWMKVYQTCLLSMCGSSSENTSHNIHIARYQVAQLDGTLYSISHTNKHLQRRIREKSTISFSLTQSAMNTFPNTPNYVALIKNIRSSQKLMLGQKRVYSLYLTISTFAAPIYLGLYLPLVGFGDVISWLPFWDIHESSYAWLAWVVNTETPS